MSRKSYFSQTDKIIAEHIKLRRIMLNMSQSDLAKKCGISFQQIQKYESAANRISCSRLFQISQILKVPIEFFFDKENKLYDPESLKLLTLYWKLSKYSRQNLILKFIGFIQ